MITHILMINIIHSKLTILFRDTLLNKHSENPLKVLITHGIFYMTLGLVGE